ncbi:unnamed protein product [Acanthoscelides obtectus]|uniref:Uncharacterized protein n=1 Tax=Acanthoscelides obtectus TaxID=200917 RepID=A0A9P0PXK5_ACAOB|nr:unnamed protein product [Acanthoscelides obtectus]CAK1647550.1 hypothetical protein AOBTE_LOCUS15263 [Acanthoscelides obtectus]
MKQRIKSAGRKEIIFTNESRVSGSFLICSYEKDTCIDDVFYLHYRYVK